MKFYIDPGTGSMLFTILIGILGALRYLFKSWFVKLRFFFSGGRKIKDDTYSIPIVIFGEGKQYWNVFKPICREFDKRGIDVVYMTTSEDDPALQGEYKHIKAEFIGKGNKAFAKLNFLKADVLLSTTPGLDVYQWKKSRDVKCYVHIPHAASDITLYRMFGIDYYDSILVSGDYQTEQIRELENIRSLPTKEIVKVGIPYMDDMLSRLKSNFRSEKKERVILVAPSWGSNSLLNKFGEKLIGLLLETGYKIIIRPHPQSFISEKILMDRLQEKYPETEQLKWNSDADNFFVLNEADMLISDFSGVIFDFALVYDKPVIYTDTEFDVGPYDAWWIENPIWTFEVLPKLGMKLSNENLETLKQVIDICISDSRYIEGRMIAREETWAHQGDGARRVVDFVIDKHKELCNAEVIKGENE